MNYSMKIRPSLTNHRKRRKYRSSCSETKSIHCDRLTVIITLLRFSIEEVAQDQIRTPNKVICIVWNDIGDRTIRETELLGVLTNEAAVHSRKKSTEIAANPKLELHFETREESDGLSQTRRVPSRKDQEVRELHERQAKPERSLAGIIG